MFPLVGSSYSVSLLGSLLYLSSVICAVSILIGLYSCSWNLLWNSWTLSDGWSGSKLSLIMPWSPYFISAARFLMSWTAADCFGTEFKDLGFYAPILLFPGILKELSWGIWPAESPNILPIFDSSSLFDDDRSLLGPFPNLKLFCLIAQITFGFYYLTGRV